MFRYLPSLLLLALVTTACDSNGPKTASESIDPIGKAEIDREVKALAKELKKELLSALDGGDPAAAIKVCRDTAPALTAAHSERTGWDIRRSASRLRNRINAPDAWERGQLELFAQAMLEGVDPATLTTLEIVGDHARFARAIPTGEECLLCHGPAIPPETQAALDELYPEDKATGFAPGELRGIFSVKVPLK